MTFNSFKVAQLIFSIKLFLQIFKKNLIIITLLFLLPDNLRELQGKKLLLFLS